MKPGEVWQDRAVSRTRPWFVQGINGHSVSYRNEAEARHVGAQVARMAAKRESNLKRNELPTIQA